MEKGDTVGSTFIRRVEGNLFVLDQCMGSACQLQLDWILGRTDRQGKGRYFCMGFGPRAVDKSLG